MSILDGILGNLDGVAEKLGLSQDQLQSMLEAAKAKMGDNIDLSTLMQTAEEHGISLDKVQDLMGGLSVQDLMGKAQDMLGQGGEGGLGGLADMAKGFFGKE